MAASASRNAYGAAISLPEIGPLAMQTAACAPSGCRCRAAVCAGASHNGCCKRQNPGYRHAWRCRGCPASGVGATL